MDMMSFESEKLLAVTRTTRTAEYYKRFKLNPDNYYKVLHIPSATYLRDGYAYPGSMLVILLFDLDVLKNDNGWTDTKKVFRNTVGTELAECSLAEFEFIDSTPPWNL